MTIDEAIMLAERIHEKIVFYYYHYNLPPFLLIKIEKDSFRLLEWLKEQKAQEQINKNIETN